MGGTPVFSGTRVPIENLLDYLEGGESISGALLTLAEQHFDVLVTTDKNLSS